MRVDYFGHAEILGNVLVQHTVNSLCLTITVGYSVHSLSEKELGADHEAPQRLAAISAQ